MRHLIGWMRSWFAVPPELTGKERWAYGPFTILVPIAVMSHVGFFSLFLYWHVFPLAIFNVFSILIWSLAFWTTKRLYLRLTPLMCSTEILAHGIVCFVFVGWDFGYQYHMIPVLAMAFLVPVNRWESLVSVLSFALVLLWARHYTMNNPPLVQVDPHQLGIMYQLNLAAGLLLLAPAMFYLAWIAERAEANLETEHRKSEALLNNVLPEAIAARLKTSPSTIADSFPEASVLFADIAEFTPMGERMQPAELVQILEGVFSCFDELVDKHQLEKIKTIGDAYMVASGVPFPRVDHAHIIAEFALDMRTALAAFTRERGTPLQLRIGINSGAVVAGVIGKRRMLYDLWGDSVNTASRLESHGVPGKIQVSETTANLLSGKFILEKRGVVEIKGKGPMTTYWLKSRVPSHLVRA